ncbi:MAG: STAS domain-containing protein [Spirochaetales bacterium]|nr:STAS domain-containing protein [Leptospiraceae bacterium]MCP5482176.1 STAS domain-containing protein [Spirochaetales bacterium]MCP5484712.1 STAS domain-containing protein [Spirochaetales bacterium]
MSDSSLSIQKQESGGVTIVKVAGKLDAKTAPGLNNELKGLIAVGKVKLVIDMSGVSYIASAGVGTLKANLVAAKKASGDLRLAGLTSEVRDVLDVLGFTKLFVVTPSVADAMNGL